MHASIGTSREHRKRSSIAAAAAANANMMMPPDEEEEDDDDLEEEDLALTRSHLQSLRSALPTALNSPARAGRPNATIKAAERTKAASAPTGRPASAVTGGEPSSPTSPTEPAPLRRPGGPSGISLPTTSASSLPASTMRNSNSFAVGAENLPIKVLLLGHPPAAPSGKSDAKPAGIVVATPHVEAVRWAYRRLQLLCFASKRRTRLAGVAWAAGAGP